MADSFTENIKGVADLIESDINKIDNSGNISPEGVSGDKIDVLDLPMSDEELLKLRDEYEKAYAPYEGKIKEVWKRNIKSYLGHDPNGWQLEADVPMAANLQFEAEETFLPAALARNPDPLVYADDSPEGNAIADATRAMLVFHADQLLLKRKLTVMVRQWSVRHLGVLKPGWNAKINDVALDNRKIQDFVFDPNGFVDVDGDFSSWLGERITISAQKLIDLFPKHKDYIVQQVGEDKLGTEVTYTEWWTDEHCFSTFKEKVLDKHKNEYFNYEEKSEQDELGMVQKPQKRNHFAAPKKPYIFLSVFSLQEQPHDITGLIEQNIRNQDKINRRTEQIDANISQSNNGLAFSENNFTQETAKQASDALTKGVGKVLIPAGGPVGEAIVRIQAPSLPNDAFTDLENNENHLRSSWGVQGISSQPPKPDETARGMVLNQGRDTSRIGGGISDVIEQTVARGVYNWLVQLYHVFYDEQHFAAVMGIGKAVQYIILSNSQFDRQLIVAVAPNSMMPKDETAIANEATNLAKDGFIGPKTLLERLKFPNADDAAADGILWRMAPQQYLQLNFPEQWAKLQPLLQQQAQAEQQAQQQQIQQQAQAKGQELNQNQASHEQKMAHNEETHQQKITHSREIASAKLAQQTEGK